MSYTYKYPRPAVTADVVAITKEEEPKVLLIQRGFDPYKGCWAFLGGFMEMDETTEECAIRELEEETGIQITELTQIGAYSKVDRDPRGRTITVAYLAIVDKPLVVKAQDDAAKAEWLPINALPPLAFDHEEIIVDAITIYKTNNRMSQMELPNSNTPPLDYESYCQQQLNDMLDDMDGRCFGDMAEGQFVRSH